MGSYAQTRIGGPEEKRNLFDEQAQVRFRDRAVSARRQNMGAL
jgi:hypothetical protein